MEKQFCIVLRAVNYKDYDKMLALFSRTQGRIDAQARGARKLNSAFRAASQPLCCGEFEFYKKGERLYVTSVLIKQEYFNIQNDYQKYTAACVMLELIEKILQNEQDYEQLFVMLINVLYVMEKSMVSYVQALAYFLTQVIDVLGVFPSLDECVCCGMPIKTKDIHFSPIEGGAVCRDCLPNVKTVKVTEEIVQLLKRNLQVPEQAIKTIVTTDENSKAIVALLSDYLCNMVDITLKTMKCVEL
ncbi:MAG: DNA repair protein RecO [Christensenellaceae bacterium]